MSGTRFRGTVLGALALAFALVAAAVGAPIPPPPTSPVTDGVGFLSPSARGQLEARLRAFEAETGHQVIVYIGDSTGGAPLEEWCARAFEAWGVGRKGKDDGAALFLFASDRALRIEVGYGLEGVVPDAVASRIIREVMLPRLGAGDRDGAVAAGVDALLAAIGGEVGSPPPDRSGPPGPAGPVAQPRGGIGIFEGIVLAVLVVGFLILLITHPSLALWLLLQIVSAALSGGRGGGGGGGGWSGGGGRSGGGGASGRW